MVTGRSRTPTSRPARFGPAHSGSPAVGCRDQPPALRAGTSTGDERTTRWSACVPRYIVEIMKTTGTRTALVTGSSRGIGRAVAVRLARDGFDVAVHFRRDRDGAEETARLVQACGRASEVFAADLEWPQEVDHLATRVAEWAGAVRVLVASAAATAFKPALAIEQRHLDRTYRVVVGSLFQLVQGIVPVMPAGSSIITISGTGATHVIPRYALLGSAKAAQEALVRYLAVELAPLGIRVNGISPGIIATDSTLFYMGGDDGPLLDEARRLTPAGRAGTPDDVAGVAAFLASPDSDFVRGQVIVVDGGLTLGMPALYPGSAEEDGP